MANISDYLNNILSAVYGKDVRQSIHDGIEKINDEVELNQAAESERVQAEELRVQAETDRESAEILREQSETGREDTKTEMEAIITDMNEKIATDYYRGPQGIQGVGIGLSPKGKWIAGMYVLNDWVVHNGAYWWCKVDETTTEPSEENNDWEKLYEVSAETPVQFEDYTKITRISKLVTAISNLISGATLGTLIQNIKAIIYGIAGRVIATDQTSVSTDSINSYYCEIPEIRGNTIVKKATSSEDVSPDNIASIINSENFVIVSTDHNNLLMLKDDYYNNGYGFDINIISDIASMKLNGENAGVYSCIDFSSLPEGRYTIHLEELAGAYSGDDFEVQYLVRNTEGTYESMASLTASSPTATFDFSNEYTHRKISIHSGDRITYDNYVIRLSITTSDTEAVFDSLHIEKTMRKVSDTVYDSIKKYDIETVKCYQRTGLTFLSSTTVFELADDSLTNTIGFGYIDSDIANNCDCICSYFKTLTSIDDTEGIIGMDDLNGFRIYINRSRLSSEDLAGFLSWLSDGNKTIEVIYEKASEIVTEYSNPIYLKSFGENGTIASTEFAQPLLTIKDVGEIGDSYYAIDRAKIDKASIAKNFATNDPEMVAAAPLAKELKENVNEINNSLTNISNSLGNIGAFYIKTKPLAQCGANTYANIMVGTPLILPRGKYILNFSTTIDTDASNILRVHFSYDANINQTFRGSTGYALGTTLTGLADFTYLGESESAEIDVVGFQTLNTSYTNNVLIAVRIA